MSFSVYGFALIIVGLFAVWGTLAKPAFFWSSRKAMGLRKLIGDGPASVVYLIIGVGVAVVGVLSMIGIVDLG